MSQNAREDILGKLKSAPKSKIPERPFNPALTELTWTKDQLVDNFIQNLSAQTAIVHRLKNIPDVKSKLAEICAEENITAVMASTDSVVASLDLPAWGKTSGVTVCRAEDYADREAYKDAVFTKAQAGITGADYGVAESGTIGLIHDKDQPRLVSVAPITHIVLLPVDRLVPVFESVTDCVFEDRTKLPSQFTFTTGPSMTGDIQGGQFKGMHGPRKLIVMIIG